jgi:hypothetical protein
MTALILIFLTKIVSIEGRDGVLGRQFVDPKMEQCVAAVSAIGLDLAALDSMKLVHLRASDSTLHW